MTMDAMTLLLLAGTGLVAGFVDAIAGGGGTISLPILLSVGVPPISALATNKAQSIVGTAIAVNTYWRRGLVSIRALLPGVLLTMVGSVTGALVISHVDTHVLNYLVPVALIAIACYFLFAPRLSDVDQAARLSFVHFVPLIGLVIGFYDGVFGPGTGSFFAMAFVTLFGLGVTRATGNTKVMNFASNLGALLLFIFTGAVLWPAAAAMAVGQVAGGYLGAVTGIRFGSRIIRPLVVVVSIGLALRLLFVH
ncbi:MAG TPA: TSUP family transporter [Devosiaceae bacterium]|jgi:hypothetical protein